MEVYHSIAILYNASENLSSIVFVSLQLPHIPQLVHFFQIM